MLFSEEMALLQENASEAERLAKELAISQLQTTGLAGAIATAIFLIVGALALLNMKLSKVEKI